mmetsp:Transcript_6013/g.8507  ORF Transcript_6013/g.8507 Transcript_6013/m.8507 type:complete len:283 (+) Transcript_6013:55-903(+)
MTSQSGCLSVIHVQGEANVVRYKLTYFNVRGTVECVRLCLCLVDESWEDCRYPIRGFMGVAADFVADQAAGKFRVNMGSVPILEIRDDNQTWHLGQSAAMLRFLGARYGLFGSNEKERATIDALLEHVRDIQLKWFRAKRRPARDASLISYISCVTGGREHILSDKMKFLEFDLPKLLVALESALPSSNPLPWVVGTEPTIGDVAIYHLLSTASTNFNLPTTRGGSWGGRGEQSHTASFFDGDRDAVRTALARAPRLRASVHAFAMLPRIQLWEKIRPSTIA